MVVARMLHKFTRIMSIFMIIVIGTTMLMAGSPSKIAAFAQYGVSGSAYDAKVLSVQVNSRYNAGDKVTLGITVKNQGSMTVDARVVANVIDSSDRTVYDSHVSGTDAELKIAAGGTSTAYFDWDIPTSAPLGTYKILYSVRLWSDWNHVFTLAWGPSFRVNAAGSILPAVTPEQLKECQQYGIPENECTENAILAKRRLIYLQDQSSSPQAVLLSGASSKGTYSANIYWWPSPTQSNNEFVVTILDANHAVISSASYTFAVFGDGDVAKKGEGQSSTGKMYAYQFEKSGSYTLRVSNINGSGEYIEIPIQVTPEFPLSLMLVAAVAVGTVATLSRIRSTRLVKD